MAEQEYGAPEQINPTRLGDYLEAMSKSVFQSGMSWRVIKAKWPTINEAFQNFDVCSRVRPARGRMFDRPRLRGGDGAEIEGGLVAAACQILTPQRKANSWKSPTNRGFASLISTD